MVVYDKYYVKNKEKPQYVKKERYTYCSVSKKKQIIKNKGSTFSKQNSNTKIIMH